MRYLLLIIFMYTAPVIALGQNSAESINISVSANIEGIAELITIQALGVENEEIQRDVVRVDPIQSERAGKMVARGAPNSQFRLDYLRSRELTNSFGPEILIFNYQVAGNRIDEQESAELLDQEVRDLEFNEDG